MEAFMQQALRCKECHSLYDFDARAPYVTRCGHTACRQCLVSLQHCPDCRLDFEYCMTKNHYVLEMMESYSRAALKRHLQDALPPEVLDECSREEALQAVSLASRDSWQLSLREGDVEGGQELTGTLRGGAGTGPLGMALCLLLATQAHLREVPAPAADERPVEQPLEGADAEADPGADAEADAGAGSVQLPIEDMRELCRGTVPRDMKGLPAAFRRSLCRTEVMEHIRSKGVARLTGVVCGDVVGDCKDYSWALVLLLCASPTLQELWAEALHDEHLMAIHDMLRLRRLAVSRYAGNRAAPLELPPLPRGHAGLRWLRVEDFPPATLRSLVRAHSATLEELQLRTMYDDLHAVLHTCTFRALRTLRLLREDGCRACSAAQCRRQRLALELVLPGVRVVCSVCEQDSRTPGRVQDQVQDQHGQDGPPPPQAAPGASAAQSAAGTAAVPGGRYVVGRNINGKVEWVNQDGEVVTIRSVGLMLPPKKPLPKKK